MLPNGDYEIHISNLAVTPGIDRPLLSLQIIVDSNDFDNAREIGQQKLKDYLYYLTFVTNMSFRIHKLLRIIDWTPGLTKRDYHQYENFPDSGIPFPILNEEHIRSIELLNKVKLDDAFKRVLKWFSNGVSAEYMDDQFQFFWFSIELLSQLLKNPCNVNDLCPTCKNPLYCENCSMYPTHRPYPKQAINQLIEKIVTDDPDGFFKIANDIRNALMHGESIDNIEKSHGINLSEIVNKLGKVAWTAILIMFRAELSDKHSDSKLIFNTTNRYTHLTLSVATHMTANCSDPYKPVLSEFPKPNISLEYHDKDD